MACPLCLINPDSHSFTNFGKLGETHLLYTAAARVLDYKETPEKIINFKMHLDTMKGKRWIWVLDSGDMEIKHYSSMNYTRQLAQLLMKDHEETIQGIWILRPNLWMRTTLKFLKTLFKAGLFSKVRIFEGEKLEVYIGLEKAALNGRPLQWLGSAIALKPNQALPQVTL